MERGLSNYFSKIFMWMFIGLVLTGLTGYFVSINALFLNFVLKSFYFLIFLEIIIVIKFSSLIKKINSTQAILMFLLYAFINGLTFSGIFAEYKLGSMLIVLLSTSIFFIILSLYGFFTKQDLTKFGTIMFIGLISAIIVSIINMFLLNSNLEIILSIVVIVIFLGLTAFDIQRLKAIYYSNSEENNIAVYGALELYLDFINIFIRLLSLFGRGKD